MDCASPLEQNCMLVLVLVSGLCGHHHCDLIGFTYMDVFDVVLLLYICFDIS